LDSWLKSDRDHAANVFKQGLRLAQQLDDRRTAATYLEALAWIAAGEGQPARAVALMGAAQTVGRAAGNYVVLFPDLAGFHQECDRRARDALDVEVYDAAREEGRSLRFDDAAAYALAE